MAILREVQLGNLKIEAELKLALSGSLSEVTGRLHSVADALAGKQILQPADLHTLQPHKGCSPEACEIEEVRKHEAEQVAISARQSMTIQDLLSEKVLDKDEIAHLRAKLNELQAKYPGSSVLTLPVLTPDERESERVAGAFSEVDFAYGWREGLLELSARFRHGVETDVLTILEELLDPEYLTTVQLGRGGREAEGAGLLNPSVPVAPQVRILPPPISAPTSDDLSAPPNTGENRTSVAVLGYAISNDHIAKVDGESTKGGHADPTPGLVADLGAHHLRSGEDGTGKDPVMPAVLSEAASQEGGGSSQRDAKAEPLFLYDQAVAAIGDMAFISISLLQRKLRISFNIASGLIDALEKNGLIGAAEGQKPRKVLKLDASVAPERSAGEDGLDREGHPRADGGEVSEAAGARQQVREDSVSSTSRIEGQGIVAEAAESESGTDVGELCASVRTTLESASVPDVVCGDSVTSRTIPHQELICALAKGHASDHENGDGASWTSPTDAERGIARPLEGKETNALLKTGESIATRAQKAVESASADLAKIEEGLFGKDGPVTHKCKKGCGGLWRAGDGFAWLVSECCQASALDPALELITPVASDLALRDGVTPAVPEKGEGSTETPNEKPSASHHEEQGRAAQGTGHPENEAAPELNVDPAPQFALADHNAAPITAEGERAVEVDPPAPVNQCEVPNKGCPKEGLFDEGSGGYFCADIHLLLHKEIRRTWAKVAHPELVGKRWRGRPLGSKNKPKAAEAAPPAKQEAPHA